MAWHGTAAADLSGLRTDTPPQPTCCEERPTQDVHPDVAPNGTNANEDTCATDTQPTPHAMLADRRILLECMVILGAWVVVGAVRACAP